MTVQELCRGLHEKDYDSAREELRRRRVFTVGDWALIVHGKIRIGMSEDALLCSWGSARSNRTLTSHSEHLQYVYGPRTYVYVENGIVTAIQDEQP